MNISVVIITKNEEHNIARCINSCAPLGAEVIVLDSQSTDQTKTIAEGLGADVYTVEWKGYGGTKNLGAQKATHNWILSVDADEALDDKLVRSILNAIKEPNKVAAYWLARSLVFRGKQLSFGAVKNEKRLRLYQKNKMSWNLNKVHEELEPINKDSRLNYGELSGSLLHHSYKDLDDMRKRLEHYAKLSAKQLKHKSRIYLFLKKIVAPTFSFIKNYYLRKGYADGAEGKIFAKEQASYVRKKYTYAQNS